MKTTMHGVVVAMEGEPLETTAWGDAHPKWAVGACDAIALFGNGNRYRWRCIHEVPAIGTSVTITIETVPS